MRLSKTSYYADFVVYAVVVATMLLTAAVIDDWPARGRWVIGLLVGGAAWTLLEYLLHRFAFHRLPIVTGMHAVHHDEPRSYIGTPTWLSVTTWFGVIFLPAWWGFSVNVASGLTAGVMVGFLWYGVLHHAIHHRRPRLLASRLRVAIRRHLLHHHSDVGGNFGVTTSLWDHVFGTEQPHR